MSACPGRSASRRRCAAEPGPYEGLNCAVPGLQRTTSCCAAPGTTREHRGPHEHPRIPSQDRAARIRRAGAARRARLHGRGSGQGRRGARRPGLGGEGPDPRRRPRQGGRRQGRQIDRRREEGSDPHPRLDAGHASDRPARQEGQPPLHRGRLGHRSRVLSLGAGRPRNLARRFRRLDRRRHGHRGSRAQDAGEDSHLLRRSGHRHHAAPRSLRGAGAQADRRSRQADRATCCPSSMLRSSART